MAVTIIPHYLGTRVTEGINKILAVRICFTSINLSSLPQFYFLVYSKLPSIPPRTEIHRLNGLISMIARWMYEMELKWMINSQRGHGETKSLYWHFPKFICGCRIIIIYFKIFLNEPESLSYLKNYFLTLYNVDAWIFQVAKRMFAMWNDGIDTYCRRHSKYSFSPYRWTEPLCHR